jgi:predicted DNA-binding transcriptional regulator AlpA
MDLRIERIDTNNFRIQGEIKIEFSMFEKASRLMESLIRELSEHKSSVKEITKTPHELRPHNKRFLSVQETAEYLGISPRTIYNKIGRGDKSPFPIKPKRFCRRVTFDMRDLNNYLDSL